MDDGLRGDPTTGAWSVFDNEGLAHARGEPLTDQARQDVGRAAGGESDNETNGTGWVAARTCEWRGAGKRGKAGAQVEESAPGQRHRPSPRFARRDGRRDDL